MPPSPGDRVFASSVYNVGGKAVLVETEYEVVEEGEGKVVDAFTTRTAAAGTAITAEIPKQPSTWAESARALFKAVKERK